MIAGIGPNSSASAHISATPVGVASSLRSSMPRLGALRRASSSVTAGAGLGSWPWAASTVPSPTVIGLQTMRSMPSDSSAAQVADDVDDGVDRPDFVELDIVGGRAMHGPLDVGEHPKRRLGTFAHSFREIGGVDQLTDHPVAAVVWMTVLMIMVVIVVEHDDVGVGGGDPAARHVVERQGVAVEIEPPDDLGDHQRLGSGVDQRRHGHVTGGAGEAVEPCGSCHCIILAIAHAAPNPLSIPTTVTPLAHDACIASSAVMPSRLAP